MNDLAVLEEYLPSTSSHLNEVMFGLTSAVWEAAETTIDSEDLGLEGIEKQAAIAVHALKVVNGVDLAAILIRGNLVRLIREKNYLASHPNQYTTMQEMAQDQGISLTELSITMDLVDIIFPYIKDVLGRNIAVVWEDVGKANFKEMASVLKSLITREDSSHESVRTSVNIILDDVAATLRSSAEANDVEINEETFEEDVRRAAIDHLVEQGGLLTNRELRNHVHRTQTPHFDAAVIIVDEQRYIITGLNEDQWAYFNRQVGGRMDPIFLDLREIDDIQLRQSHVLSVPEVRELVKLLGVQ